jgi:hypothetical protein
MNNLIDTTNIAPLKDITNNVPPKDFKNFKARSKANIHDQCARPDMLPIIKSPTKLLLCLHPSSNWKPDISAP